MAVFYASRYLLLKLFYLKKSVFPEFFITPRGLITVLLFFSIPAELKSDVFNADIILITILATSFIMTWGLIKFNKDGVNDRSVEVAGDDQGISYFVQRLSGDGERKSGVAKVGDRVDLPIEKEEEPKVEDSSEDEEEKS